MQFCIKKSKNFLLNFIISFCLHFINFHYACYHHSVPSFHHPSLFRHPFYHHSVPSFRLILHYFHQHSALHHYALLKSIIWIHLESSNHSIIFFASISISSSFHHPFASIFTIIPIIFPTIIFHYFSFMGCFIIIST